MTYRIKIKKFINTQWICEDDCRFKWSLFWFKLGFQSLQSPDEKATNILSQSNHLSGTHLKVRICGTVVLYKMGGNDWSGKTGCLTNCCDVDNRIQWPIRIINITVHMLSWKEWRSCKMKEKMEAIRRTRKSAPEMAFRPLALKSCFFDSAVRLGFCRSKLSIQKQKVALPYFFFHLSSLLSPFFPLLHRSEPSQGHKTRDSMSFHKALGHNQPKIPQNPLSFPRQTFKNSGRYIIDFKSL